MPDFLYPLNEQIKVLWAWCADHWACSNNHSSESKGNLHVIYVSVRNFWLIPKQCRGYFLRLKHTHWERKDVNINEKQFRVLISFTCQEDVEESWGITFFKVTRKKHSNIGWQWNKYTFLSANAHGIEKRLQQRKTCNLQMITNGTVLESHPSYRKKENNGIFQTLYSSQSCWEIFEGN